MIWKMRRESTGKLVTTPKLQTFAELMQMQGAVWDLEGMLFTYQQMCTSTQPIKPSVGLLNTMLARVDSALELLSLEDALLQPQYPVIPGRPRIITDGAKKPSVNIVKKTRKVNETFSRAGHEALNLSLSLTVEPKSPVSRACTKAILMFGKSGEWAKALSVLDSMEDRGIAPEIFQYNAAISACGKNGEVQKALELFETMEKKGVTPDIISWNAIISACSKDANRLEKITALLADMRNRGILPDLITYSITIPFLCSNSRLDEGLRLTAEMRKRGFTVEQRLYQAIRDAVERSGRAPGKQSRARGKRRNDSSKSRNVTFFKPFSRSSCLNMKKFLESERAFFFGKHQAAAAAGIQPITNARTHDSKQSI